MRNAEVCNNERRRSDVRESDLSGLDYVEVNDGLTMTVYFLGKAPRKIGPEHVRIEGGRRVTGIQVVNTDMHYEEDPELDDYMGVTVDKTGDFSSYTLRLVDLDHYEHGSPVYRPFPGFDARYDHVEFSFKAGCRSDLDCKVEQVSPPARYDQPEINYLAKDYASFRQLILDRLALTLPGWQERHVPDIGITLAELLAYVGDYLSYYQDAVATEAYLGTARQRISVRRHARLIDYPMHEGCNARTWLFVHMSANLAASTPFRLQANDIYFITGCNGALAVDDGILNDLDVQRLPAGDYEVFEPLVEEPADNLSFYQAHNDIWFYTWGDQECWLPRGATSATLQDYAHVDNPDEAEQAYLAEEVAEDEAREVDEEQAKQPRRKASKQSARQAAQSYQPSVPAPQNERVLNLHAGDFLLFEEARGTKTGLAGDADSKRRHVVRLTKADPATDALYNRNVLEIEWEVEDALPFPLCISTMGQAPECKLLQNISVARGNILLVDHGRTVVPAEKLEEVQEGTSTVRCDGEGRPGDTHILAKPFNPVLKQLPLTFRQLLPPGRPPASALLKQEDPCMAEPQITLTSLLPSCAGGGGDHLQRRWLARRDLLESDSTDCHFVVEIDNDGYTHLRFGDNELGCAPEANEVFTASYRVGNGPSGNVGPESISRIVFRHNNKPDALALMPRNPFAATGGALPETLAEVKLFAPHAFHNKIERAITADDYARIAKRLPQVQNAAASLRWSGSGYDVLVAIDPKGTDVLDETLRSTVQAHLERFRRIGHDVLVVQAEYVAVVLAMTVCVQPHYLRWHVKADLLKRFSNRLLPDGAYGFFHPDRLTFGGSITVSALVAAAQSVPGVISVTIDKLERFGEGPDQELRNGVMKIGPMEIAQLNNDPSFPERGTLTITMKGGR